MMTFGNRLKILADKLGKEDQDVAHDLGLSKAQMSHYTTGKRKVPSDLLQKIVDTYGINPEFLFNENAPLYLTSKHSNSNHLRESNSKYSTVKPQSSEYYYFPVSISAGMPFCVDSVTEEEVEYITVPDSIMGKWANSEEIFFMRVNGDSMNLVVPNQSLIAVRQVELSSLSDNDIVVFSDGNDYSVKRFFNDPENQRFIFRPDSSDNRFIDYSVPYEESQNLKLHGKVVLYIVSLD